MKFSSFSSSFLILCWTLYTDSFQFPVSYLDSLKNWKGNNPSEVHRKNREQSAWFLERDRNGNNNNRMMDRWGKRRKTVTTTSIIVPEMYNPGGMYLGGLYPNRRERYVQGRFRTRGRYYEEKNAKKYVSSIVFEEEHHDMDGEEDEEQVVVPLDAFGREMENIENIENMDKMDKMDDDDRIRYRRKMHNENQKKKKKSASDTFELQYLNKTEYSFAKIGGCEEIKNELLQMQGMIANHEEYKKWNVRLPRGVLLYGEPGNGKTLLAKCFTGETGLPIISTSGAHFQEKYVGTGAARIRELFEFARKEAPCIIYIDEIDAVARRRGSDGEAAQAERDSTLNQLLVEMDGFGSITEDRVIVMGSTNRLDILDPAIIRPGRFDKKLSIPRPNADARSKILDIHLERKPLNVSKEWLVHDLTVGMSGAEMEHLLNEASLFGIRHSMLPINSTVMEAVREVLALGLTSEHIFSPKLQLPSEVERRIAVHEMGHVLVSIFSPTHPSPRKVTIYSPSSQMLGYTIFGPLPSSKNAHSNEQMGQMGLLSDVEWTYTPTSELLGVMSTKNALYEKIQVLLGGRMAEELMMGPLTISSGASDDFKKAKDIAYEMILNYGMGADNFYPTLSDQSKRNIDKATLEIIQRCTENVRILLHRHQKLLEFMTDKLLEHGSLQYFQLVEYIKEFSKV